MLNAPTTRGSSKRRVSTSATSTASLRQRRRAESCTTRSWPSTPIASTRMLYGFPLGRSKGSQENASTVDPGRRKNRIMPTTDIHVSRTPSGTYSHVSVPTQFVEAGGVGFAYPPFRRQIRLPLALCNELLPLFGDHRAQVLGISIDGVWCHRAFACDRNLRFPLLSDFEPKGAASRAYGVYSEEDGTSERALFVIDGAGIVRWSFVSASGVKPGAGGVLRALEDLGKSRGGLLTLSALWRTRLCPPRRAATPFRHRMT